MDIELLPEYTVVRNNISALKTLCVPLFLCESL